MGGLRALAIATLVASCGGGTNDAPPAACTSDQIVFEGRCIAPTPSCAPDESVDEAFRCTRVGVLTCGEAFASDGRGGCDPILPDKPCLEGTMATPGDTTCRPVGPADCAAGFAKDERGECAALLPSGSCPEGLVAVPGDASCRAIASCADAPIGDLHVDASAPAGGDGSAAKPFRTLSAAVDAADASIPSVIAIESGAYTEPIETAKPVTFRGRCPDKVTIAPLVLLGTAAVERLTVRGVADALVNVGGTVTLDRVRLAGNAIGGWVHDHGTLTVRASAVDGSEVGLQAQDSAKLIVESTRISDLKPLAGDEEAYAVLIGSAADVQISGSALTGAIGSAFLALGGTTRIESTVVRDVVADGLGVGVGIDAAGPAKVTVDHVLVERAVTFGIRSDEGADLTVRDSTIREITSGADVPGAAIATFDPLKRNLHVVVERVRIARISGFGMQFQQGDFVVRATRVVDIVAPPGSVSVAAIGALRDPKSPKPLTVLVEDTAIAHAPAGLELGGDATVTRTEVIDVGNGITIGGLTRDTMKVTKSRVERAKENGIRVFESDATLEDVLVRDVHGAKEDGHCVSAFGSMKGSNLTARRSLFAGCESTGVFAVGGTVTLEDLTLRDMPGGFGPGRGIEVDGDRMPVLSATLTLKSSTIQGTAAHGLFFDGDAQASVDGLLLRAAGAQGLQAQGGARVSLAHARLDDTVGAGVFAIDAALTVDASLVTRVRADADGAFGDGISVGDDVAKSSLSVTRTIVRDVARAGLSTFGSTVRIEASRFACASFDLDAEPSFGGASPDLTDGGQNVCGCEAPLSCRASSANLTAVPRAEPAAKPKKP